MFPTQTVTFTLPIERDAYGDPKPGTGESFDVVDVLVAPRTSSEPTDRGRTGVVVGLELLCPEGTREIPHTATVTIPGYEGSFQLDGDPAVWPQGGVVVNVKRGT